ncbi:hypothetical protein LXL04_023811 [Taraxacum kok-saghyz]
MGDDIALREKFPRLYALEINKKCSVEEKMSIDPAEWQWRCDLSRGQTNENLESLKRLVSSVNLSNAKDRWSIDKAPKDSYSVSWFKDILNQSNTQNCRNIWSSWIPKRKAITAWRILRNRIPFLKECRIYNYKLLYNV